MQTSQLWFLTVVTALLVTCAWARGLPDYSNQRLRQKRQFGDIEIAERQAALALGLDGHSPAACTELGCGLVDIHLRVKRASSDQRIAELQALIALAKGRGGAVGHGRVDPFGAGKRKRSYETLDGVEGEEESLGQLLLLQRLLEDLMDRS